MDLLERKSKIKAELEHVLEKVIREISVEVSLKNINANKITQDFIEASGIIEILNMAAKAERYDEEEKAGLRIKLPCKEGTEVFRIINQGNKGGWIVLRRKFELKDYHLFEKRLLFLTNEDAEAERDKRNTEHKLDDSLWW